MSFSHKKHLIVLAIMAASITAAMTNPTCAQNSLQPEGEAKIVLPSTPAEQSKALYLYDVQIPFRDEKLGVFHLGQTDPNQPPATIVSELFRDNLRRGLDAAIKPIKNDAIEWINEYFRDGFAQWASGYVVQHDDVFGNMLRNMRDQEIVLNRGHFNHLLRVNKSVDYDLLSMTIEPRRVSLGFKRHQSLSKTVLNLDLMGIESDPHWFGKSVAVHKSTRGSLFAAISPQHMRQVSFRAETNTRFSFERRQKQFSTFDPFKSAWSHYGSLATKTATGVGAVVDLYQVYDKSQRIGNRLDAHPSDPAAKIRRVLLPFQTVFVVGGVLGLGAGPAGIVVQQVESLVDIGEKARSQLLQKRSRSMVSLPLGRAIVISDLDQHIGRYGGAWSWSDTSGRVNSQGGWNLLHPKSDAIKPWEIWKSNSVYNAYSNTKLTGYQKANGTMVSGNISQAMRRGEQSDGSSVTHRYYRSKTHESFSGRAANQQIMQSQNRRREIVQPTQGPGGVSMKMKVDKEHFVENESLGEFRNVLLEKIRASSEQ